MSKATTSSDPTPESGPSRKPITCVTSGLASMINQRSKGLLNIHKDAAPLEEFIMDDASDEFINPNIREEMEEGNIFSRDVGDFYLKRMKEYAIKKREKRTNSLGSALFEIRGNGAVLTIPSQSVFTAEEIVNIIRDVATFYNKNPTCNLPEFTDDKCSSVVTWKTPLASTSPFQDSPGTSDSILKN